MILYFTGTGNSRYVAEGIANVIDDEIVSINDLMKKEKGGNFSSEKPFVFIAPIYGWRIPRIVGDFIKNSSFSGSNTAYFIVTCGDTPANAVKYIKNSLKNKNLELLGFDAVNMPENYIAMFEVPEKEIANTKVKDSRNQIIGIANKINANESFFERKSNIVGIFLSAIFNPLFYRFFVSSKGFKVNNNCNACGTCVKSCSTNNIELFENKPVWANKCTHCMACISICPKLAIDYNDKTQGKERYYLKDKF